MVKVSPGLSKWRNIVSNLQSVPIVYPSHSTQMKFQVQTSFFNFDTRGNSKKINVGTLLSQKQYKKLTPSKQAKCTPFVNPNSDRNDWKREEVKQLIELYVKNDNLHWVRDTFIANNPSQPHSEGSVYQTVAQLRTLDIQYPMDTQWKVTALTEELALEMYPNRFGSVDEMKAYALQLKAEAIISELVG